MCSVFKRVKSTNNNKKKKGSKTFYQIYTQYTYIQRNKKPVARLKQKFMSEQKKNTLKIFSTIK